jgi:hypothetical protein
LTKSPRSDAGFETGGGAARIWTSVATNAKAGTPKPPGLLRREARIAFATIAGSLILVLGLRLIAKDAPSAERSMVVGIPTPAVSTAAGCENFARYWIDESGVSTSDAAIEGMTNCRRATDGTWFVPAGPEDPRLPNTPILTEAQEAATAELRTELLSQIHGLEAQFPSTLQQWLNQIYDPIPRAVTGHLRDGISIRTARGRYTRLTQAYLMAPERQVLADYVGWIMARRIRAYDDFAGSCLGDPSHEYLWTACRGLEDSLSIRFPPLPWELEDPLLLDGYLASTLQTAGTATPAAGT